MGAFRPGSSVGMSVRLKSGRSPVRSRPWPHGYLCSSECCRTVLAARRPLRKRTEWGQTGSAASLARSIVERVERGGDVVKLIVKQVRVGVRGDGDRCVASPFGEV